MNANFAPLSSSDLVLRVLGGRQKGADYRLTSGLQVRVGHGFGHDIVLRCADNKDLSLEIDVQPHIARLRVISGQVTLLGRPLVAGEQAQLPPFVPVSIGDISFAIGEATSDRWDDATTLSETPLVPMAADGAAAEPPASNLENTLQHFAAKFRPLANTIAIERRWPLFAGAFAVLLLAAILVNPISALIQSRIYGPQATQEILTRAGFKGLAVKETGDKSLLISGVVRDDAELARLRSLVGQKIEGAVVDVNTMDGLAAAASDIMKGQGFDAESKPGRGRSLIIDTEYMPGDRQKEMAALIKQDLPYISNIFFNINGARGENDLQYFFSGSDGGIATYIEGNPSYIETPGQKWFKGSDVPTGHTIVGIGNGRVSFERDGQIEELLMMPQAGETAPVAAIQNNTISTLNEERTKK
jgi:type III secretion protein D